MNPKDSFKWRHFEKEIILVNARWYHRYALSYRDLKEMMQERGLEVKNGTRFIIHSFSYDFFRSVI